MGAKVLYAVIGAAFAAFAASIIYIIVDKTTECQGLPNLPENAAASFNGTTATVYCLPGYSFPDGKDWYQITCSSSWNTEILPKHCLDEKQHPVAVSCLINSSSVSNQQSATRIQELNGNLIFLQEHPLAETYIQGNITGLDSTAIQQWDLSPNDCYLIEPESIDRQSIANNLFIDGNQLKISAISENLNVTDQFSVSLRILGFSRPNKIAPEQMFNGVAVFVVEQNEKTSTVLKASSIVE